MAGRPPIEVTDKQIVLIGKLAGYGMTEAAIAHCIGMSPKTFYTKKGNDPRIPTALENGKALAEQQIGQALYVKAIGGDLGSIIWWEKTRAGRYERSRQEFTGKDGAPIQHETLGGATATQYLDRELARLAALGAPEGATPKPNGRGR